MGIPTLTSANIEDAVAGIGDDITAIVKVESERCAGGGSLWEEDAESVVTASAKLLFGQAFVLEEGKCRAIVEGDGVDLQGASKLNEQHLIRAGEGAKINSRGGYQGIIGLNGGVDLITQSLERNAQRNRAGKSVGTPDIVVGDIVGAAGLPDEHVFLA